MENDWECEVPAGRVCECVSGASGWGSRWIKDPWSGSGRAGCGQGSPEDRGAVPVSRDLCAPALVTFCLQQRKRRKGTGLSGCMLHVSSICRCHWRQRPVRVGLWPAVSVSPLRVSLGYAAALRRVEPAAGKAAAASRSPGRGSPRLEQAAALLTSLIIWHRWQDLVELWVFPRLHVYKLHVMWGLNLC